jgi:hypothetical protein
MQLALGRSSSQAHGTGSRSDKSPEGAADRAWPRTEPDEWCGEWDGQVEHAALSDSTLPIGQAIAIQTFLGRVAPSLESMDIASLLEALLNQLPPDIRRVIVRMNGLDGQPLSGLKDVAREFRMSREQVRELIAVGEKRLAEAVGQVSVRRKEKRDA